MRIRTAFNWFSVIALMLAIITRLPAIPASAQQTSSGAFPNAAASPFGVTGLSSNPGQWCHVTFTGATGAIHAQASSDGMTWVEVPSVSYGGTSYPLPFTPNPLQTYLIAPQTPYTYLRILPASFYAGNSFGYMYCDFPSVTPTPVATNGVNQIVPGNCVTVSPSGGQGIVTVGVPSGCSGGGGGVAQIVQGECTSPNPGTGNAAVDNKCTPVPFYPGPCTSPYATQYPDATQPTGVAVGFGGSGCTPTPGTGGNTAVAGPCINVTATANPTGGQVISQQTGSPCAPTTAPNITVTTTPCGAAPAGGLFQVTIPACSPGTSITFPLPVNSGGTGTSAPSPQVTATDCDATSTYSGTWPSQTLNVAVPCFPSPNPTSTAVLCTTGSGTSKHLAACPTNTPLDAIQLSDGASHQYKLSDTGAGANNCPNTFADTGGGTQTVAVTPNPAPTGLICGAPSITSDGEASLEYRTGAGSDFIMMQAGVWPTSSPAATSAWTVEFVAMPNLQMGSGSKQVAISMDNSDEFNVNCSGQSNGSDLTLDGNSTTAGFGINGGQPGQGFGACTAGRAMIVDVTYTNSVTTAYINSVWVGVIPGYAVPNARSTPGAIGANTQFFASSPWLGRLSKIALYPTVLTQTQIYNHYFAFKCGSLVYKTCAP